MKSSRYFYILIMIFSFLGKSDLFCMKINKINKKEKIIRHGLGGSIKDVELKTKIDKYFLNIKLSMHSKEELMNVKFRKHIKSVFDDYFYIFIMLYKTKENSDKFKLDLYERMAKSLYPFVQRSSKNFLYGLNKWSAFKIYFYTVAILLGDKRIENNHKEKIKALLGATSILKKLMDYFEYDNLEDKISKQKVEKNVSIITYIMAQNYFLIESFINNFAFAQSIFSGDVDKIINKINYIKIDDILKRKHEYISLATNFKMKLFLIKRFFSKKKENLKKIALEKIKKLRSLNIKNIVIDESEKEKDDLVYCYLLSEIKIKEIIGKNKERKVFLIKLPSLQQVSATCKKFSFVNSCILAKKNNLKKLLMDLNNTKARVNKINIAHGSKGICDFWTNWTKDKGLHFSENKTYDYNRFKCGESAFINCIVVVDTYGKFNIKNDDIIKKHIGENKSDFSEIFMTFVNGIKGGHVISTRIEKTKNNKNLVIYYADSENLIKGYYDDNLFVSLAKLFDFSDHNSKIVRKKERHI